MTTWSMKSLLMTALCAGVITGLSIWGHFAAIGSRSPGRWFAILAALPSVPGDLVAAFIGIGHGPDGFPTHADMVPYVFTFLLWWGFLYFIWSWRRQRGATRS
jgi:hypothetical protein